MDLVVAGTSAYADIDVIIGEACGCTWHARQLPLGWQAARGRGVSKARPGLASGRQILRMVPSTHSTFLLAFRRPLPLLPVWHTRPGWAAPGEWQNGSCNAPCHAWADSSGLDSCAPLADTADADAYCLPFRQLLSGNANPHGQVWVGGTLLPLLQVAGSPNPLLAGTSRESATASGPYPTNVLNGAKAIPVATAYWGSR